MHYELRLYEVVQGRMADMHARMRDHLSALFGKHGVNVAGRWSAIAGPRLPLFVYLMAWPDWNARETAWAGFYGDPEWPRVRAETNAGSEMVGQYDLLMLKPAASWKAGKAGPVGGLHELRIERVAIGQAERVHNFISGSRLPLLEDEGARVLGVFDIACGVQIPAVATFLAWPDEKTQKRGWLAYERSRAVQESLISGMRAAGRALLDRSEVYLLEPAEYALPDGGLKRVSQ
jgi:hypothetical protein